MPGISISGDWMKNALLIAVAFALVLTVVPMAHAAILEWDVDISLNDDKTSDWVVTYLHSDNVQQSDIFLLSGITSFNVTADDVPVSCTLSINLGSSIVCNNFNAKKVVYHVHTIPITTSIKNLEKFSHRFTVTQTTGKVVVSIKLPYGAALVEQSKLQGTGLNSFEPSSGKQGSDGRRIFVEWDLERPQLGETNDYSVVFEYVKPVEYSVFIIILAGIIAAFLILLYFFLRKRNVKDFLPVLTDQERKIMEIIIREKQVDQRVIVKETDFSKAKVSRILQDLEKRGLIDKKPKGRTNIITLKKAIKWEKTREMQSKQ